MGIDGAAHEGALEAGGVSVGVMATGIEYIHPRRHRHLGQRMAQSGALVTEFEPGTPPLPHNFPRRNRIISGLSLGVLVVEAALPSGSLITAHTALAQGREVFALPWSPLHSGGRGCLRLLRDGAHMVEGIDDILEALDTAWARPAQEPAAPENPAGLLALVGYEPVALEQLVQHASRPVSQLLGELSELELAGKVTRVPGGYIRT
jgi:DNA processing protein